MPSERLSAEWSICALKAPFGKLRLPLHAFSRKCSWLLCVCVRLLSLHTRVIGLNQIRTVCADENNDGQSLAYRFGRGDERSRRGQCQHDGVTIIS